jgi:thioredoxin-related protein
MRLFKLLLMASAIILSGMTSVSAQVRWASNVDVALPYAQSLNKFVFVYVFTKTAQPCQQFQNNTLRDPMVIDYLNKNFISTTINAETNRAAANRYGVFRVPTTLILDSNGKEFSRLVTYYPPDELLAALKKIDPEDVKTMMKQGTGEKVKGAIFQESFDSLYGWGNDGSKADCTMQFSLVTGVVGRAFKVNYNLIPEGWSYAQFNREFAPFTLPEDFTIVFQIAGKGGRNHMDLKFIDMDYDSWGAILWIPTDFKPHRYVLTSKDISKLWGEGNGQIDPIKRIQIAITPDRDLMDQYGVEPTGDLYLDELLILPGIRDPESLGATRIKDDFLVFTD